MDTWRQEGLSLATMRKLNACRMWLQVSRLSEITLADGSCLHPDPLDGRSPHGHHKTNLKWPRQDRPPPKSLPVSTLITTHIYPVSSLYLPRIYPVSTPYLPRIYPDHYLTNSQRQPLLYSWPPS